MRSMLSSKHPRAWSQPRTPWQDLSPTKSEQCHLLTHCPELLEHASLLQSAGHIMTYPDSYGRTDLSSLNGVRRSREATEIKEKEKETSP